jgi:hypothetical protein
VSHQSINEALLSASLPRALRRPQAVAWNRLEPRPRTVNFERSLRAEVRDALWMLTRQWQFGEFKGEDAGTPVLAKIQTQSTQLTRFSQRGGQAVTLDKRLPLEARAEREKIPLDPMLCAQMGEHWLRLLRHQGLGNRYRELYRTAYPMTVPAATDISEATLFSNVSAWQFRSALAGRGMNGGRFYTDLKSGLRAENVTAGGLSVEAADRDAVSQARQNFTDFFERLFSQPQSDEDSTWIPERLEYQFACSAPAPEGEHIVLLADEYYQGHLDWHSFDIDPVEREEGATDEFTPLLTTLTLLPSRVQFAGMPNVRWWEFEDGRTDFGAIDAHTTDLAKLLLIEFGLIYGNDWSIIPFVVPVGSLCEIKGLVVTDVFGQRTLVRAAGRGRNDRWNIFNLSARGVKGTADRRLFIPPSIGKSLEGEPIETVNFLRDEMANMVWAVESKIPDELGGGMDGQDAATQLSRYLQNRAALTTPAPVTEDRALLHYRLANTVPENWIPFIPVHAPDSNREIQLQRGTMLRLITGEPPTPVEPRGDILRPSQEDRSLYYIYEEEVPRAGALVMRSFQRARWWDGSTHIWLGRRKQTGRGEGTSGLKFDQVIADAPNRESEE